jgi:hypothetical protein
MTKYPHPITPPPELVQQWEEQFLKRPTINGCFIQSYIATKAAQWGADQELEACITWLVLNGYGETASRLRTARRPKPPSLKAQAQVELDRLIALIPSEGALAMAEPIRRALEALDD